MVDVVAVEAHHEAEEVNSHANSDHLLQKTDYVQEDLAVVTEEDVAAHAVASATGEDEVDREDVVVIAAVELLEGAVVIAAVEEVVAAREQKAAREL